MTVTAFRVALTTEFFDQTVAFCWDGAQLCG